MKDGIISREKTKLLSKIKRLDMFHYIEGAFFVVALFLLYSGYDYASCKSKWKESKYGLISGCLVKTEEGYYPEKNIRKIYWVYEEINE